MRVDEAGEWFTISTNIDFAAVTRCHRDYYHTNNDFTAEHLLAWIFGTQADVYFSALYSGDLLTSEFGRAIVGLRFGHLLWVTDRSQRNIEAFQDATLGNGRAVREAVGPGRRGFGELLGVLEEGRRFKEWIGQQEPDASLIEEYLNEMGRVQWIATLPMKAVRIALCAAAGLVIPQPTGTAAGLALSAFDQFLTEALLGGWRPNQFVEAELRPFSVPTMPTV